MKKLLVLVLLITGTVAVAQPHFGTKEYFTGSVYVDPGGSIKEKGLDFGADIGLVSYGGYVKAGFQSFDALEGGYYDIAGAGGLNLNWGTFEEFRTYAGIRLGLINRGYKDGDSHVYPLFGTEAGVDYFLNEKLFVGAGLSYDWREDFLYSGAEPEYQGSGKVKIGITW